MEKEKLKGDKRTHWMQVTLKVQWLCRRESKRDIDNCCFCCSELHLWCCSDSEDLLWHCTMRTLESRNSSGLIAPGHISKNHQRYSKERHFFFKLSTRRKIEKIQFPWVSYSKFSILAKYASVSYTQICIWYRAILLEDASDASVPLYKYGSILHTVPPYFPMYALCTVSWPSGPRKAQNKAFFLLDILKMNIA